MMVKLKYKIFLICLALIYVGITPGCRSKNKTAEEKNINTESRDETSLKESTEISQYSELKDKQLIIPDTDLNIKVYVPSLDRKIELRYLKDNMQKNISEYMGTYNWLMNPASEDMNGSWTELKFYFKNNELNVSSIFYAEAEPDPEIHLKDASIFDNYFYAKDSDRIIRGKFVYFEDNTKNKIIRTYGLLVKGDVDYEFYEKIN